MLMKLAFYYQWMKSKKMFQKIYVENVLSILHLGVLYLDLASKTMEE